MTLTDLTVAEAGRALAAREVSAVELTAAHNAAVAALNPRLNAFITATPEQARRQAEAADRAIAAGAAVDQPLFDPRTRQLLPTVPVELAASFARMSEMSVPGAPTAFE